MAEVSKTVRGLTIFRTLDRNDKIYASILLAYFSLHVAIRFGLSEALTFDECEQVYLSQWWRLGYNGQPPLYTWVQKFLLDNIGVATIALPLLKNIFLGFTYWLLYRTVRHLTGLFSAGLVGSFLLLTIPQIAWESHRDLSHTVAATFAVVWLFAAIVSVWQRPTWRGYAIIGAASAAGLLLKYNFAIILLAFIIAGVLRPSFRRRIIHPRILLSLAIAIVLVGPHVVWVIDHVNLASGKATQQMLPAGFGSYLDHVRSGALQLIGSSAVCMITTVIITIVAFRERLAKSLFRSSVCESKTSPPTMEPESIEDCRQTALFLQLTLLITFAVLAVLVVTGYSVTVKNHWLQPYIVLVPMCVVLTRPAAFAFTADPRRWNSYWTHPVGRLLLTSSCCGAIVLGTMLIRPSANRLLGRPDRLNWPAVVLARAIRDRVTDARCDPILIATDMRMAGNLCSQLPEWTVYTTDFRPDLKLIERAFKTPNTTVLVAADNGRFGLAADQPMPLYDLSGIGGPVITVDHWQNLIYPDESNTERFGIAEIYVPEIAADPPVTVAFETSAAVLK